MNRMFFFAKIILGGLLLICTSASAQVTQWTSRGIGGGGALFSPSFDPHNANELYLACDMGQLFHSTNLGASWSIVDFRQIVGRPGSVVRFTNNSQIRYSIDFAHDQATPVKSTDGGRNWQALPNDPTGGEAYSLFVDSHDANKVILSSYNTIYFSVNGGTSFTPKFSQNGGNGCYVAGAFFDGVNIYIGTNAGLLVSTDGGASFNLSNISGIPATQGMLSFAGAKAGETTRFFCVTAPSADLYPGITGADHEVYQSVYALDFGQTNWAARVNGINNSHHPFFVAMVANNINVAYLAGGSTEGTPIVYKTTNGGQSWQSVLLTNNNQNIHTGWSGHGGDRGWSYGEYALGFAVHPSDPNKTVITDLGFAHLTIDAGATWQQIYLSASDQNPMNTPTPTGKSYHGSGLENTSCWWLTWSDANNIFASFSDIRGIRSTDGGNTWSFNYTGHTLNSMYQSVKHPSTGVLYAATSSAHDMYQSTYLIDTRIDGATGQALFSANQGQTWQVLHDFGHPVIGLALDPNNPTRLYASVVHSTQGGIFVSNNIQNGASSTWTKLANPPRTQGHPFNIHVLKDGTLVCTYSGRRAGNPLNFTNSSGVFVSTNAGQSWLDRSDNGMLYWAKDLVIDPHDSQQNTWYACVFSGWGGPPNGLGGLYRTSNRGQNWTRILNLNRVGSCAINPQNRNEMYVTTEEDGLWYTQNFQAANPAFTPVASFHFHQPERVFYSPHKPNEIWVTSFGGGLWVGNTIATSVTDKTKQIPAQFELMQNHPNPFGLLQFSPATTIRYYLAQPAEVRLAIYDVAGSLIVELAKGYQDAGSHRAVWKAADIPAGIYLAKLQVGKWQAVKKIVLAK